MEIKIKGTNIKLTPDIYNLVNEKIGSLEKFIEGAGEKQVVAEVEVGRTTKHHQHGDIFRAEVNLSAPGEFLRAESEEENLELAVTNVKDELQIQLKKYKDKELAKVKRGGRLFKRLFRFSPFSFFGGSRSKRHPHEDE